MSIILHAHRGVTWEHIWIQSGERSLGGPHMPRTVATKALSHMFEMGCRKSETVKCVGMDYPSL